VWLLSKGDVTCLGVIGVKGEAGVSGDVTRGIDRSPPDGISDIRCLFLKRAMKPFRPGLADAGGLATGTLNLPVSVALDSPPGGFNFAGS